MGMERFVIPNREVREIFLGDIQSWFEKKARKDGLKEIESLIEALSDGEEAKAESIIDRFLLGSISYFDGREAFYHGFMLGVLNAASGWSVKSNRECGNGRSDIMMLREDAEKAIILELKHAPGLAELEKAALKAVLQIDGRNYGADIVDLGVKSVLCYGIAFHGKRCALRKSGE